MKVYSTSHPVPRKKRRRIGDLKEQTRRDLATFSKQERTKLLIAASFAAKFTDYASI